MVQKHDLPKWGHICCNIWNLTTSWFRQRLAWSNKDLHLSFLFPNLLCQRNFISEPSSPSQIEQGLNHCTTGLRRGAWSLEPWFSWLPDQTASKFHNRSLVTAAVGQVVPQAGAGGWLVVIGCSTLIVNSAMGGYCCRSTGIIVVGWGKEKGFQPTWSSRLILELWSLDWHLSFNQNNTSVADLTNNTVQILHCTVHTALWQLQSYIWNFKPFWNGFSSCMNSHLLLRLLG
jgi:hypothetical protein